jgi:hypothetical protein
MIDQTGRQRFGYPTGSGDDLEAEHDGREPDADLEPSLGGGTYGLDVELDTGDDEPNLGWCDVEARSGRYSDDGLADMEVPPAPAPAYHRRLAKRRKVGPTAANIVGRRNWRSGATEIVRL